MLARQILPLLEALVTYNLLLFFKLALPLSDYGRIADGEEPSEILAYFLSFLLLFIIFLFFLAYYGRFFLQVVDLELECRFQLLHHLFALFTPVFSLPVGLFIVLGQIKANTRETFVRLALTNGLPDIGWLYIQNGLLHRISRRY